MTESLIKCPTGHPNPTTQKFCGDCGVSLVGLCSNGHQNPDSQRYCGECGTPLIDVHGEGNRGTSEVPVATKEGAAVAQPPTLAKVAQTNSAEHAGKEPESSCVTIGATFTTGTGEQALVRAVTGNDVWVDVQRDGTHVGTFRFPLAAVETAMANQIANQPLWQAAMDERVRLSQHSATQLPPPNSPQPNWTSPAVASPTPTSGVTAGGFASGLGAWWRGLSPKAKIASTAGPLAVVLLLVLLLSGSGSLGRDQESYDWGYRKGSMGWTQNWANYSKQEACQSILKLFYDLPGGQGINHDDAMDGCMDAVKNR